jgi:hypothetical protein
VRSHMECSSSYCGEVFRQRRAQWIRLGQRNGEDRVSGKKSAGRRGLNQFLGNWTLNPGLPWTLDRRASIPMHLLVRGTLPPLPHGPLTWQTWVRGSVDSGWQVKAAIRNTWDAPARPLGRL